MKTEGGFLISRIKQAGGRVFERMLKECGVAEFNGAQGRILSVLWQYGAMPITHISKRTSLAKTTLTGMLERMEASGLVTRAADPRNRRQALISLTERARGLRDDYDRVSERINAVFYRGFSHKEIIRFENTLRRIIANLENAEGTFNEKGIDERQKQ